MRDEAGHDTGATRTTPLYFCKDKGGQLVTLDGVEHYSFSEIKMISYFFHRERALSIYQRSLQSAINFAAYTNLSQDYRFVKNCD